MRPVTAESAEVIRAKLRPPPAPWPRVPRPRLEAELAGLIERHRRSSWPRRPAPARRRRSPAAARRSTARVAWLTLDRTDAAPGRLLDYLEAALARPGCRGSSGSRRSARGAHPARRGGGAARRGDRRRAGAPGARRARAAWGTRRERLGRDRGARALRAGRAAGRADQPLDVRSTLGAAAALGTVAAVGEATLAFTPDEAAEALAVTGADGHRPARRPSRRPAAG